MLLCLSALARRFSSREQESEACVSLCFHMSIRNHRELISSLSGCLIPWVKQDLRIKLRRVQIVIRENIPFTLI